ncbi:GHKL domain-containing protein [Tolypothrix sp. FACHB-123]|uniref:sensor histidine kinase n=1 Tax=Tolypothrix sp. FACHB-123 TaxID=2692868 RepID=UPI00168309FF|nr:ATP-binding protein [Tolypothrix sp. FACHB-123]MBD2358830.1 GHKL domain-containing protein [Tolypothrix sp. FACHB-123]
MKKSYNFYANRFKALLESLFHKFALRPAQIIAATVVLTLLLFVPQTWLAWQTYQDFNNIIKHEFRLQSLSNTITYLDEVLTMSARMNAATGNVIWEERYRLFEPKLDAAIKESIKLAPQAYAGEEAKKTDIANQRLVEMEYKSFDLVKKAQNKAAKAILSSREYENEKQKYAAGVANRNHAISLQLEQKIADYRQHLYWSISTSLLSLLLLIPSWLSVLRLLKQYLKAKKMTQAALEKTNTDLEFRVENRTQELTDKNIKLRQTLKELQYTQMQLIQQEKMFSLGQLVAGIAHEINNPINFIHGNLYATEEYIRNLLELLKIYQIKYPHPDREILIFAQEIDLSFLVDDLAKILSSMRNGTERIREIVIGLRNFSRLDEADFKVIDIHEGIDSTLLILKNRLQAKPGFPGIQIIKEYGKLPLVECYPGKINQVFMHIITNAIDALEEKSSQQSYIRICTEVTNKNTILIRIIDNGSGIPEDVYSHLFDPFFTTKPVGKGTGLGLSISYQIVVEKHGGKLVCNSKVGEGTEFIIEIPIRLSFPSCHISQ